MYKNYLISSLRSLMGDRLYASINTIGLAIGLATAFLIFSWVRQELKYDRQYEEHERVYRIVTQWDESPDQGLATTYPMMKAKVLTQFPEIENCVRLFSAGVRGNKSRIAVGDKIFTESKVFYGDTSFFTVFPFTLIKGSTTHLFNRPNAVILTERASKIYFGDDNPIDKTILLNTSQELVVTGVIKDIPSTTHFNFDILVSMQSHPWIKEAEESLWSGIVFHTYLKIKPGSDAQQLTTKINNYLDNFPNDPDANGRAMKIALQPVTDIHLKSHLKWELQPNGNITYVYIFITIAILVIAVACINYINLATARYTQRVKEVGIRKVLGAMRKQLIFQFMSESLIVVFASLLVALVIIQSGHTWLQQTTEQEIPFSDFYSWQAILLLVGTTGIVGLGSGFLPALILSGFKPVQLFKSKMNFSPGGSSIRKGLVVFQFTISIILTVCTVVTYRQLQFVRAANLGYDKEQVIILPIRHAEILPRYKEFKSALLANSHIISASATSQLPTHITEGENIDLSPSETKGVYYVSVDEAFFKTMNINVLQGEDRIKNIQPENGVNNFVLNESALKEIGWDKHNALGKMVSIRHGNMKPGQVVGIVSDFHFQSLHQTIGPLVMEFDPDQYQYLLVKLAPAHIPETVNFIHDQWKKFAANIPFNYTFLDHQYNQLYKSEKRIGSLFLVFASIASVIALLGLFGLASFAVEKRTKEIGIRKVLGASYTNIISLLMKDFLFLLVMALAIALPASYYYTQQWLQSFAYRTPITTTIFILAGLINFLLATLTLLYHGLKASNNNPVESLKSE